MQVLRTNGQFATGQASLTVTTATVPTSGSLTVQLTAATTAADGYDGVAGLDSFRMVAGDWVGAQGRQLQYEFRYMQVLFQSLLLLFSYLGFCTRFLDHISLFAASCTKFSGQIFYSLQLFAQDS